MKLKQIGLSSMILTGLLATNAVHAQDETIIEDNSIQVVSIYKTSDASSVEQLKKDLKDASTYYRDVITKRDKVQRQLMEATGKQQELSNSASTDVDDVNATGFGGVAASMPLTYTATSTGETVAKTDDVDSLKKQLELANAMIDDTKDVYVNVLSRYEKVFETISDEDIKAILDENTLFDREEFSKLLNSLVSKARETKRVADEQAKKEAEEQAKKEAAAKEAARNRQITTVDFAPIDPNFTAAINGGAWGNCTYYVYNRVAQLGKPIPSPSMGHAFMWSNSARGMGYNVSHTPKTGTIAVFSQGVAGSDPTYGHVAFVEKVFADGSVLVSEMNVQGLNVISIRIISASDAQLTEFIDVGL